MQNGDESALRLRLGKMMEAGLKTQTEPFPETDREFSALLGELRALPPDDLQGKLVLSGFVDKPYGPDQMRCNRSDDGVGVVVAQTLLTRLKANPRPYVRVFDAGTGGIEVMFQARGCRKLIIIDASRTGAEPGALFRVPGSELTTQHEPTYSLHDFRWDHALAAGRKIFPDQFPRDVTVYLIEAASLDLGLELSAPVRAAAERVLSDLQREIDTYEPTQPAAAPMEQWAEVARGNIYLSRESCDTFLPGTRAIALLQREARILILPLTTESGSGLLLKIRNARGDRVIHAQEFFRDRGYVEDFETRRVSLQWDSAAAGLVLGELPKLDRESAPTRSHGAD
jgi:hydrogenase maturation protease